MKAAVLIAALATSASAVFVDPKSVSSDKIYELRDAKNSSHLLAACDSDILCVVNTGGDFTIQRRAVPNPKQNFRFPSGALPASGEVRKEPSFAVSQASSSSRLAQIKAADNVRLAGQFTVNMNTQRGDNVIMVEQSSNGLGVVLKAGEAFVGVQDGAFTNEQAANKVDQEYEFRLFEVGSAESTEPSSTAEEDGVFTIQTINPTPRQEVTIQTIDPETFKDDGLFTIQTINPTIVQRQDFTIQTIDPATFKKGSPAKTGEVTIQTIDPHAPRMHRKRASVQF